MPELDELTLLFDRTFDRHYRVVHAFLVGQASDADAAADLLQDTFVRVWRHVHELRALAEDRRLFWILGIARNLSRDHYRRKAARTRAVHPDSGEMLSQAVDSGTELQVRELRISLDSAMSTLPEPMRTALTLTVMTGLSSAEIGRLLQRPAGTVRYQVSEARRRLARELGLTNSPEEAKNHG